jgi:cytochrome c-type biogenesis protein CcmH/NrfG
MRRGSLLPAAAAVFACLPYLNALNNPFVYDDHDTVIANPSLIDLSNVTFLFLYSPFRPVVNLSYALDRWLWNYRPLGFHLTNILLHASVVVLLYLLLRRILADSGGDARPTRRVPDSGAAAVALASTMLFAAHPIQTEAVAYVSGRSELMCGVWFLAAVVLARDAITLGSRARAVLAGVAGALSIASKEVGLVIPIVILAYDWLLRPGDDARRRRRLWQLFIPGFALALTMAGYRLSMLRHAMGGTSPVLNLLTQTIVIWRYIGLLIWPSGQSIMHGVHRVTSVADPVALVASAGLATVCVVAFRVRRQLPVVAFGLLWFLIVLAPSSSVVTLVEGMAEHRVYLASAGIFIAIAGLGMTAVKAPRRGTAAVPAKYMVATAALITLLCALTVMRNRVWGSPILLWGEAALHAEGMWEPHYALADSLRESGDCGAAVPEYRKVVELSPSHRDAYVNLGICLAQTGQLDAAERAFRRALEIDPRFARGYTNLGALALVEGDPERARDFYREAIAQDSKNILARMQLASLYEHTFHDYHAAARMCGEARLIAPSTAGVVECVERNQQLAMAKDQGR